MDKQQKQKKQQKELRATAAAFVPSAAVGGPALRYYDPAADYRADSTGPEFPKPGMEPRVLRVEPEVKYSKAKPSKKERKRQSRMAKGTIPNTKGMTEEERELAEVMAQEKELRAKNIADVKAQALKQQKERHELMYGKKKHRYKIKQSRPEDAVNPFPMQPTTERPISDVELAGRRKVGEELFVRNRDRRTDLISNINASQESERERRMYDRLGRRNIREDDINPYTIQPTAERPISDSELEDRRMLGDYIYGQRRAQREKPNVIRRINAKERDQRNERLREAGYDLNDLPVGSQVVPSYLLVDDDEVLGQNPGLQFTREEGTARFRAARAEREASAARTKRLQEAQREDRIREYRIKNSKKEYQRMIDAMQRQVDEDRHNEPGSLNSRARTGARITAAGIPPGFSCPITYGIMTDPVIASDGFTYERQAIEQWMRQSRTYRAANGTSPSTNQPFRNNVLTPNRPLRDAIHHFFNTDPANGVVRLRLDEDDLEEDTNFNF